MGTVTTPARPAWVSDSAWQTGLAPRSPAGGVCETEKAQGHLSCCGPGRWNPRGPPPRAQGRARGCCLLGVKVQFGKTGKFWGWVGGGDGCTAIVNALYATALDNGSSGKSHALDILSQLLQFKKSHKGLGSLVLEPRPGTRQHSEVGAEPAGGGRRGFV